MAPLSPCWHSGVWDLGHQLAEPGCPVSPRRDRTLCPEAPGSRDPRKGWLLPVPPPTCHQHHGPKSSKAPKPPSAPSRGAVSHGGDNIQATAQSQGTSKDRNRRRSQALAPGDALAAAQGHPNRSHLAAVWTRGDSDGDPAVSPRRPRPPHPPGCTAGPGVMGKAAAAGTRRGPFLACPLPQPPPLRGRGQTTPEHRESADATGASASPAGSQHVPDAGVPPGRAPAARQHRPAPAARSLWRGCPRAVAVPAGTASCHPAAPCFPASASHPRWYRRHKAALSLGRPRGVMPASVPGPVPPPLTPLPPQGTAPGDASPCGGAAA